LLSGGVSFKLAIVKIDVVVYPSAGFTVFGYLSVFKYVASGA
jgi:hypothetical protein